MNGQILEPSVEILDPDRRAHVPCPPPAPPGPSRRRRDGGRRLASPTAALALALLLLGAPRRAAAEDTDPSPAEDSAAAKTDETVPPAVESVESVESVEPAALPETTAKPGALRSAVDDLIALAHGSVSAEYRLRHVSADTDQDLYNWLDLRFGNENTDRLSATFFARTTWDLDRQRKTRDGYEFTSLADTHDSPFLARLYSGYLTWRPAQGPAAMARIGRQYVNAVETFHLDGVYAESRELQTDTHLTATLYGGVPVHLYEASPAGDWITGASVSAEPFRWTRATADYVHVSDDYNGAVRNDLAALRVWQRATPWLDLYGRVTYLEALRDAELRATGRFDDQDLIVQASWFRLLEPMDQEFTAEFDPYFYVLHTLQEYDQGRLRAVKGFGDDISVEVGADIRQVRNASDRGAYNRDTRRFYVTPTFESLLWKGAELTLTAERWSGNGERLETYGAEVSENLADDVELSIGTDYSLYGYDGFRDREREHVRSVFWDLRWQINDRLSLRGRYSHEKDDEETYDVFTLGLTLAF